jgi:hypothetical protein
VATVTNIIKAVVSAAIATTAIQKNTCTTPSNTAYSTNAQQPRRRGPGVDQSPVWPRFVLVLVLVLQAHRLRNRELKP